jgi:hypothetical protein
MNNLNTLHDKRDSLGFKLQVVAALEKGDMTYKQAQNIYGIQGRLTVLAWLRKHGTMDWTQPLQRSKKEVHSKKSRNLEPSHKLLGITR